MSGVTDLTAPPSVSLMVSLLCSTVQAPTPSLYARSSVPSLFPRIAILCRGGRHSLPQPRRNLRRSQRLKLHFLTFLVFEGKSV